MNTQLMNSIPKYLLTCLITYCSLWSFNAVETAHWLKLVYGLTRHGGQVSLQTDLGTWLGKTQDVSFRFLPLFPFGLRVMLPLLYHLFFKVERGLLGPNPVLYGHRPGYSLDESPAHRRANTGCKKKKNIHMCTVLYFNNIAIFTQILRSTGCQQAVK